MPPSRVSLGSVVVWVSGRGRAAGPASLPSICACSRPCSVLSSVYGRTYCFLLFLSPLALFFSSGESRFGIQSSRELAAVHHTDRVTPTVRPTPRFTCTHVSNADLDKGFRRSRSRKGTTEEQRKGGRFFSWSGQPPSPWLPNPPALTEQADSTPWSGPPRTTCELPIARATSPSSLTSLCPTT